MKTLKISDIFKLNILKFYFKHCHNDLPQYLQCLNFCKRSDIHKYNTRKRNKLDTQRTNTKIADNCLRNYLPKVINNTDTKIIEKVFSHSFQGFTWYIKQNFINSYETTCTINKCYVCKRIN